MKSIPSVYAVGDERITALGDAIIDHWAGLGAGATGLVIRPGPATQHPALEEVLRLFSRRTRLVILFPTSGAAPADARLAEATLKTLRAFGVHDRVALVGPFDVCAFLRKQEPELELFLRPAEQKPPATVLDEAEAAGFNGVWMDVPSLLSGTGPDARLDQAFSDRWNRSTLELLAVCNGAPGGIPSATWRAISQLPRLRGICAPDPDVMLDVFRPKATIIQDDFAGRTINGFIWAAGYSHANTETTIRQDNGIVIDIKEGQEYSGAGVVTLCPIHGEFDAQVEFEVMNPTQATTFEVAAIGVEPGQTHLRNDDLDSRTVNLTFDVHGCPPYASSERDEDDGFRIGWNNGYSLTKIDADWTASSGNMYNKYGRDVGYAKKDSPTGALRLLRNGSVFNTYYRDRANPAWVCSGSALIPNLGPDVHIRLAAKHWNKHDKNGKPIKPPANTVIFRNFRLYQR